MGLLKKSTTLTKGSLSHGHSLQLEITTNLPAVLADTLIKHGSYSL